MTQAQVALDALPIQAALDGRWGAVRRQTREFLCQPVFQPLAHLQTEDHRARVLEQALALAKGPGTRLGFPEEYGGGDDIGGYVTSFETLGMGDLSLLVKAGVQWGLFGGAIHHLGTRRHHDAYLRDVMSLDLPGCFAMTETGHGSDVQALRTTATYDPQRQGFVIHTPDEDSRKDYIGNAARDGRMAVVFAQLHTGGQEHGVHAFVVPIRDEGGQALPGVTITDCGQKAGLNGVDNGRLVFDQVMVPRDALLNRYADVTPDGTYSSPIEDRTRRFFTMVGTLVQGRVSIAGAAVSATKTALTIAVRYGLVRRQFSPPDSDSEVILMDFLSHQRRLLPLVATTYAMHFAQSALVAHLHEAFTTPDYPERERRKLESLAAGIKAISTWHALSTIQACREACGGAGYLWENRLPDLRADVDVFTTFEGDNTVLLQLVTKGLLTDYRDEFGAMDTLGMIRFVAEQVVEQVIERMAARKLIQTLIDAVPGREEDTDLLDRGYHLEMLEFREQHVIEGLARRIRSAIGAGADPFDVFNAAQDHVLLAARAHIDRVVFEHFVAAVDECADAEVTTLLDQLCDLHALSMLERDRAWYLEHGRLSAPRSKAITGALNDACRRLRPHAASLVEAFAVPDQCLAAPIALGAERARQEAKRGTAKESGTAELTPPPA